MDHCWATVHCSWKPFMNELSVNNTKCLARALWMQSCGGCCSHNCSNLFYASVTQHIFCVMFSGSLFLPCRATCSCSLCLHCYDWTAFILHFSCLKVYSQTTGHFIKLHQISHTHRFQSFNPSSRSIKMNYSLGNWRQWWITPCPAMLKKVKKS